MVSGQPKRKRPRTSLPSHNLPFSPNVSDQIAHLASHQWIKSNSSHSETVNFIYTIFISSPDQPHIAASALDHHNYFENYLWPQLCHIIESFYKPIPAPDWSALKPYLFSIIALFNFRQDNHPNRASQYLLCFDNNERALSKLVEAIFRLELSALTFSERCMRLSFLTHLFRSLDHQSLRNVLLPLISLPVWLHLSQREQSIQLESFPYLVKPLLKLRRRAQKRPSTVPIPLSEHAICSLVTDLEHQVTQCFMLPGDQSLAIICELVSLLTELLSQLSLRRTILPLLRARSTLPLVQALILELSPHAKIHALLWWPSLRRILDSFAFYFSFPIHPLTGVSLPRDTIRALHAKRLLKLQTVSYNICQSKSLPQQHALRKLSLSTHTNISNPELLTNVFTQCEQSMLVEIRKAFGMETLEDTISRSVSKHPAIAANKDAVSKLLQSVLVSQCHVSKDALESFRQAPLMIMEHDLWGPSGANEKRLIAALPTLNIEFLNMHDYLLRNFTLYKWESAWSIREEIEDAVRRLRPSFTPDGITFQGWARMATTISSARLEDVGSICLDSDVPVTVRVQIEIDMSRVTNNVRSEWSNLKQNEVLFLLRLDKPDENIYEESSGSCKDDELGLMFSQCTVRGFRVQVSELSISKPRESVRERTNNSPKLKISGLVDNFQYQLDSKSQREAYVDFLSGFNVVMRHRAQFNMFFPILSSLRDLVLSEREIIPDWIGTVLLSRSARNSRKELSTAVDDQVDFVDTFISEEHIISSFPDLKVVFSCNESRDVEREVDRKCFKIKFNVNGKQNEAEAIPYYSRCSNPRQELSLNSPSPVVRWNTIFFNKAQIRAVRSGLKEGLTLVDGPPGTGKTACVIQIAACIYESAPHERILVITKTNDALNYLVNRLLETRIDPLRVLRLGQGEIGMSWDDPVSKAGRINALLQKRLRLLSEVLSLSNSMQKTPSTKTEWSCESADVFFKDVVEKEWDRFKQTKSADWHAFPFRQYIEKLEGKNDHSKGESSSENILNPYHIESCYNLISMIFEELRELQFLEVLRTNNQRGSFLITAYSRFIFMTSACAAMQREELVRQHFAYDTLIMEESAECLEIEAFLCLALQPTKRLKRIIMVGDHKQLSPVVQDRLLQQKSNLGQSLFTRLIRAGQLTVQLCHQGRSRSSIGDLFRWRYKELADMDIIREDASFEKANPGFRHTAQFIDTGDIESELQPLPNFYQNIAEAEYIAFTFLYMRLLGYPSESIAVLTMYNDQVQLLREVIGARVAQFGNVGMPFAISTVGKFQGRQADFILLSLVKTKTVGHFQDDRRITVAVSCARYGVYIFGYLKLFSSSAEFRSILELLDDCNDLILIAGETFSECTRKESEKPKLSEGMLRNVHSPADMSEIVTHLYETSKLA